MSVIRKGFFTPDELNEAGVGKNLTASPCAKCGLYKEVKSPKMKYTGEGRLKVLIIGEAPGKTEDIQNEQFVGDAGNLLRKRLKKKGLSLDKDFWKINAVNCRTTDSKGNNRTPTKSEIKNCKYYVDKAIDELKPKFIWLFGKSAIESLYTGRFSHLEASVWRKLCIPDRKIGAYVIPMYHPSYILRAEGEPVRNAIFDMDLDFAISCLNKEAIEKEDFFSYCHLLTKADDVISMLEIILEEKPEYLAFDYETTGLKPYSKGHKIPYISACDSEDYAFSFFYQHDSFRYKESEYNKITDLWCSILIDPAIQKAAHNLKFEKIWSRVILKVDPVGLTHCTMNNAHIIDSRKHFSGLKFQSFIHFGVEPYDKSVKPFLTNTDEHGFNKVMKADPQKMLLYSAMDSLMNYKLLKKQLPVFEKNPSLERARRFNLEGLETLANIEEVGIKADKKYYSKVFLEEHEKIKTTTERLEKYKEIIEYNKKNKKPINFESGDNIRKLFFVQMGLKAPKMTEKGNEEAVDKDVLSAIDSPISKDILILRKSLKTRNTYVAQFLREIEDDERIHPFCHLNTVSTYRSSSEKPNWQNIPAHDKEATKITRSGIMPSKGFKLLEFDYASLEVRIIACYTKDPVLINYINDPSTDMHRDQAMKLFALPEEEITKDIRFHAKNSFVFASFYGSYYKNTGSALWKNAINLKTKSGKTIKEHLYEKGIIKRSASKMPIDFFIDHVKTVEEKFWKKFKVTKQWQEKVIEKYAEKGYFEMFTGFREEGYLSRNDLINWRVQGVAFHCLLWSIIQIDKHLAENGFRTKIVGQIHDSCIFDNDPEEQKDVIDITEYYATKAIKEAFPFLIVPLQLEWEATEVDKPWYTKRGIQHG